MLNASSKDRQHERELEEQRLCFEREVQEQKICSPAIYGMFKYVLLPKIHKAGANMPCSNFWNSDIPSKARISDVDLGYRIDMSKIRPQTWLNA
jgi:hypothetical protein